MALACRRFDAAIEDSEQPLRESFEREDVAEGVNSYLEGRAPALPRWRRTADVRTGSP